MTKSFNPFEIERPVLNLGEHGSYTLGDITESRGKRLDEVMREISELTEADEFRLADMAGLIGELCEAACLGSTGLRDKIVDLADESVHGEDALGVNQLVGVARFVMEWVSASDTAGEG